jgi:hypothetical protein
MALCPNCGTQTVEGDVFCATCGADLRAPAQGAPPQVPRPPIPPAPMSEQAEPPSVEPKKRTGLVIGIVVAVLLVCGCGTVAAGVVGYQQFTKAAVATSSEPESTDEPRAGSSASEAPTTEPAPANTAVEPVTPAAPAAPTSLDEKSAQALVETFLSATQKDDVTTAKSLITAAALKRIGGTELLKQKGVITGYTVETVGGGNNVWDVWVVIKTISGPEKQKYTVGMDGTTPQITELTTSQF